jgi:hypothetical protein
MYRYDASYAVEVQRAHPGRFALVKPVDPDDPAVADVIADWKKAPGTVGIRIMMTQEAGRDPTDPGLDRILHAAVEHDFPVNMLCWGNVEAGTALIDRHPETRFIIDHLAILQPRTPPAPPQPWADLPKVLELGKRPNAVIKVSGACTRPMIGHEHQRPAVLDPARDGRRLVLAQGRATRPGRVGRVGDDQDGHTLQGVGRERSRAPVHPEADAASHAREGEVGALGRVHVVVARVDGNPRPLAVGVRRRSEGRVEAGIGRELPPLGGRLLREEHQECAHSHRQRS